MVSNQATAILCFVPAGPVIVCFRILLNCYGLDVVEELQRYCLYEAGEVDCCTVLCLTNAM